MKFATVALLIIGLCAVVLAGMIVWVFLTAPAKTQPVEIGPPSASHNQLIVEGLRDLLAKTEALGVRTAGDVAVAAEAAGWESRMLRQVASVIAADNTVWELAEPFSHHALYADVVSSSEKCGFGAARLRAYFTYQADPEELRMMERHLRDCFRLVPQVIDRLQ